MTSDKSDRFLENKLKVSLETSQVWHCSSRSGIHSRNLNSSFPSFNFKECLHFYRAFLLFAFLWSKKENITNIRLTLWPKQPIRFVRTSRDKRQDITWNIFEQLSVDVKNFIGFPKEKRDRNTRKMVIVPKRGLKIRIPISVRSLIKQTWHGVNYTLLPWKSAADNITSETQVHPLISKQFTEKGKVFNEQVDKKGMQCSWNSRFKLPISGKSQDKHQNLIVSRIWIRWRNPAFVKNIWSRYNHMGQNKIDDIHGRKTKNSSSLNAFFEILKIIKMVTLYF